jgi:MoCo/4Fe-4S cofactor protein with predicted Tat translocation signal
MKDMPNLPPNGTIIQLEDHAEHDHDHQHHDHDHGHLVQLGSKPPQVEAPRPSLDITALREKLASGRGPAFWRTLDEAAETPDLKEYVEQEFPGLSGQIPDGVDRRSLLKVMAASLAMAGAAACTKQPKELIVPYVRQPENIIPGLPLFYATAMTTAGYARGLLVESHLNRPTKVEGNPDHPASLGSTTIFEQASTLALYDPDRSETVMYEGRISSWGDFTGRFSTEAQSIAGRKGEGLAILTGVTTSPTLISQMTTLMTQWPSVKWYVHEPSVNPAIASAARKIAGKGAFVSYDLSQADVIVSLESDFLNNGPASLVYARQFAAKRGIDKGQTPVRLYAIESSPSVSGSLADHHIAVKSSAVPAVAYQLAKACGVSAPDAGAAPDWVAAVAADLTKSKGRCVVIPGDFQPESVHLAAYAINAALGNVGSTVKVLEGVEPDNTHTLDELTSDLNSGHVETLLILNVNPVYSAPASLNFEAAIRKARLVVRLGQFFDETSRWSHWHVPEAHYLETWSDARAFDGTITIMQPLIEPLYGGKSAHELLTILLSKPDQTSHEIVKAYWQAQDKGADFDTLWKTSLHDGFVQSTAVAALTPSGTVALPALSASPANFEVVFRPDPTIGDGSWANNGWLQELPKPQTKVTWENTVYVSIKDAEQQKLSSGDVVKLTVNGKSTAGPVFILPGHAAGSATVFLGYGRLNSGHVGTKIGYNAYLIQDAATPYVAAGGIAKTGEKIELANVQVMQTMADRAPVRAAEFSEYKEHPNFPTAEEPSVPAALTLYPNQWPNEGYKWGMTIDLNICTGCSACIIACQAENNIAVVGKDQVSRGRHMHWIRVDRYYAGNLDTPEVYNQPVPCMHCENAPCELVCPVAATTHSQEGLNQMIYNRCVGTRYCSNNCPYKVRRFNFYLYSDWQTESMYGMRNPDVSVRSRGVMEKCSDCIQRIQEVKITTEKENRRVADGEILTACQQACPTQAITFGDLNDPYSRVTKQQALKRNYGLLDDLNTRPRTTYLGYVRNSNEALRGQRG